jgi:1-acyl-sn-glycerol-3-phosphate acyltransferase
MARSKPTESPRIPPVASERQIRTVVGAIDQLARLTQPRFYGIERVTGKRAMLVGNHTLYGVFDVPFMVAELWKRNGLHMRSLGDHRHWSLPGWREFLEALGAVRGTRENTAELMRRGEPILVFPGGAREVNKRRGEKYQLIWKNRLGFANLAIEHGYSIQPFAAVGAEEMLDVVVDDRNPVHGRVSRALERTVGVPLPSLVRGIGPTLIPRPQRFYFWFGEPIPTESFRGKGQAGARRLRDEARREVEGGIEFLIAERAADPGRKLLPRLLGRAE